VSWGYEKLAVDRTDRVLLNVGMGVRNAVPSVRHRALAG